MAKYLFKSNESEKYNIRNIFLAEIIKSDERESALLGGNIDYKLFIKTGLKIGKKGEGDVYFVFGEDDPEYVIFNKDKSVLLNVDKKFDLSRCGTVIGYQSLSDLLGAATSISKLPSEDDDLSDKAALAETIGNYSFVVSSLFNENGDVKRDDLLGNLDTIIELMNSVDDYCFDDGNDLDSEPTA